MRISLKPSKKTLGDFTIESQIQTLVQTLGSGSGPGSTSAILRAHDDKEIRNVCLRMLTHLAPEQREAYLKIMASYRKLDPHPSLLKCYEEIATVDGEVIALAFEPYQENLHDFITRRFKKGAHLTQAEVVWVSRQLAAALAQWFGPGCTHGTICPQNIIIARNGQNQLVFKIGKVQDEDFVQQTFAGKSLVDRQRIDMFDLGIALYQILTLNSNVDIKAPERYVPAQSDEKIQQPEQKDPRSLLDMIRTRVFPGRDAKKPQPQPAWQKDPISPLNRIRAELENKDSEVRKRNAQISPVFDILIQMLDPDPTKRPIPKAVQIALASIDLRDFEGTTSDVDDCIVPAGSGDAIVKTAQHGQRESQYQLSLLLRERGHSSQCVAWAQKAAEQGHVRATVLIGLHLRKGEGCSKDLVKAEHWLRRAVERGDLQAQELLSDLLLEAGRIEEISQLSRQDRVLSADVEAELGLMSLSGYSGIKQDKKRAQHLLHSSANRGNITAQLFLASLLTESRLSQLCMIKAIEEIDQHISQKKLRFVLAAVMACLKGKLGSSSIIHPFELKINDFKTPDAKVADAQEIIRGTLRGKEEVEVRLLPEEISEALNELLIYNNWPADQDYLQPIRGFCGDFALNDRKYPLMMVVPYIKQGNAIDFFKKPGNRGKASHLLLHWAIYLASAIESLHNQNLVHGDISARTVLVNENEVAMLAVSDYLCYEQENLPIKVRRGADKRLSYHLPRGDESISKASDIFAFGLTLFEIATEGNYSLYDWTISESDNTILKSYSDNTNYTLEIISANLPFSVPVRLKELILTCVDMDPLKRPTAFDLVLKLSELTQNKVILSQPSDPTRIEKLYEMASNMMDTNPKFAFALLRHAAAAGHGSSMLDVAEKLWLGEQVPADRQLAKELAHRYSTLVAKSNGSDVIEETYQTAIAYLTKKGSLADLMGAYLPSLDVRNLIIDYAAFKRPSYPFSFALALLGEVAEKGHTLAQERVAEMLWSGMGVSQDKALAIQYFDKIAASEPQYLKRLNQMRAEYHDECQREQAALQAPTPSTPKVEQKHPAGTKKPAKAAGYLRLAFQHFFGSEVDRNLGLAREFLITASEFQITKNALMDLMGKYIPSSDVRNLILEYDGVDPDATLARTILSLSTNPLDEKSPLRFYVPGGDFKPPFVELDTTVYRVPGRAFRCSIVGKIAVLLSPDGPVDMLGWLNRSAHAHPNVIAPLGITTSVRVITAKGARETLPYALLYAPVQAAAVDRAMIADPITACSRILPFLVGVAEGLSHLHKSNVVHGNLSLRYLLVGHDRLGLVAVGPPNHMRATAPESLAANHFSSASDVFHFGLMIAYMLTGGSFEDNWLPRAQEADPKTRLTRLRASATNGYADIRARIPNWVPSPLVDIMMRCLRLDRTQRPAMPAVATELQTLRSTLSHCTATAVGPRPAQFWMHTSHICLELTADDAMLREGGTFECLYGPRTRDRMRQNFNPSTNRCKTIQERKPGVNPGVGAVGVPGGSILAYPNLAAGTRKIIEYKSKFFAQTALSSWDGSEVLSRGIRHLPSYARGAMLLEDKALTTIVNRLDRPPQYPKDHKWCTGEPDTCTCERASRPKNPGVVTKIPTDLLRLVMSFLEFPDYGSLARVCRITAKEAEDNMLYWHDIIKQFGNQGEAYMPRDILIEMGKSEEQKEREKEEKKVAHSEEKQKKDKESKAYLATKKPALLDMMGAYFQSLDVRNIIMDYVAFIRIEPQQEKNYFDPLFRRWAKVMAAQLIYSRAYTSLQFETTDVLHIPDIAREERKYLIDKAHNDYQAKSHACSCCHKPVPFAQYFKDFKDVKEAKDVKVGKDYQNDVRKEIGSVFMACNDCLSHHVWSKAEATTLWGFTSEQLEDIPYWRFGKKRRFVTADLLDFRIKFPMLRNLDKPQKIEPEFYNRVPDLPEYVRQYVIIDPPHPAIQVKSVAQTALDPFTAISVHEFDTEAMFPTSDVKDEHKSSEPKSDSDRQTSKGRQSPEHTAAQRLLSISAREEKGLTVDLETSNAAPSVVGTIITSESTAETSTTAEMAAGNSAADSTTLVGSASLVEVVYTVFYRKKPEQQQRESSQDHSAAPKSESAFEATLKSRKE